MERLANLTSRDECLFLTDLILKHASGDHTFVAIQDVASGTTRFANNQIVQNVHTRRTLLGITAAFGRQHGTAVTTDLSVGAVRETLKRAEAIAQASPPDPEYLPPVPLQTYRPLAAARLETLEAGPGRRAEEARTAIEHCRAAGLQAAGIVSTTTSVVCVGADTGLFAHEPRTEARFSLTASGPDATGWAANAHRSIDHLGVAERSRVAITKAQQAARPQEVAPGRYTVILEPAAVAGLLSPLIWAMDAKAYDRGTSPLSHRLHQRIVDPRMTLRNRPDHPHLLGVAFTGEGLPSRECTWIDAGVLQQLSYDRFTAQAHHVQEIPTIEAPYFLGENQAQTGVHEIESLVRETAYGILVTNFWYIRGVNPTDLTLTGMTRDGTFMIENGRITGAVRSFRFHDSPLRAFNAIEGFTAPEEASTVESPKMFVPSMKIRDFQFSSVTRF